MDTCSEHSENTKLQSALMVIKHKVHSSVCLFLLHKNKYQPLIFAIENQLIVLLFSNLGHVAVCGLGIGGLHKIKDGKVLFYMRSYRIACVFVNCVNLLDSV